MKKLFLTVLSLMMLYSVAYADESKRTHQSQNIELNFRAGDKNSAIHRNPLNMNVEVSFDPEINCLYVSGDADAEVNLYFDGRLIEHSDSMNTTFYVSESGGIYMIEIITDSWSAIGYIEV